MMRLLRWEALATDIVAMSQPPTGVERASLHGAAGRILAEPLIAARPLPAQSHAVMDGYALGSAPPGRYRLAAAKPEQLASGEACAVSAGDAVPGGTVTVILGDRVQIGDGEITAANPAKLDNIRRAGEEAQAGATLLSPGVTLDRRHLALAAAASAHSFAVRPRADVALLALHDAAQALPHAGIFNGLLDSPAISLLDAGAVRSSLLPDQLLRLAGTSGLVVIVADSLGDETGPLAQAIAAAGGACHVRRAAMKPAKPVITGRIGNTIILGLAGTAYATCVAAHLFLRPLLSRMCGAPERDCLLPATANFERAREPGRGEALPVKLWRDGACLKLDPAGRFGQLGALAAMDGFALIDADAGPISPGDPMLFHPLLMPLV